ncbi:A retinal short-chain dehydrogenase/reductase [Madurella fahalii]|uniref:A retinal short-chain dehydrogenase/reductase n=1 Tax=Madurella fahalii TaxID=1157608 RepID=A0ABQ0G6I9_9PEZI
MASLLYSPAIDVIASVGRMVLSPFFSGPILLSVTYYPDTVRHIIASTAKNLPGQVAIWLSSFPNPPAITALRFLLTLSLLRTVNRGLSTMASNSWRFFAAKGWDWQNEIAVVTGGSSGIGRGIVERLAALGVRVAVLDIQDLPKELQGNARIRFFHCDVTSSESVAAAADAVRRELGHASILVNNAGVARPTPILKTKEEFLRRILGVNLMSMWFTTQQFLPRMIQLNKGHIVTVASIASFVALATAADYSATKAGALAFHESLTSEIKHQYKAPNVLTSVVHPNFVKTPLLDDFSGRLERAGVRLLTSDLIADEVVARIKSRRGGQLVIPSSATGISGIRGWPTWLQELVRDAVARGAVKP